MAKQLYWEDVDVGTEVTPVSKIATTQMLAMWAGASGDFNPLHYQESFAQSRGMPAVLVSTGRKTILEK
jgi:acyl dehydratase